MVAKNIGIHHPEKIIVAVKEAIKRWPDFSKEAGISVEKMREIQDQHRK